MKPYYHDDFATLHQGDCLEVLAGMEPASVHAVVTDPPYGIRFMGMAWDGADIERRAGRRRKLASQCPGAGPNGGHKSMAAEAGKYDLSPKGMLAFQEFSAAWGRAVFRVLKPGGHVLAFASTRTYHRMVCGLEEAGFEIRDQLAWVFGSGFPKSLNLGGGWEGWGTALKPAWEPIVLARKPLSGTVEANVQAHGCGGLNVEGCKIGIETIKHNQDKKSLQRWKEQDGRTPKQVENAEPTLHQGRWPANLCHDGSGEVIGLFPEAGGGFGTQHRPGSGGTYNGGWSGATDGKAIGFGDSGSAARFFYCAKADDSDRDEGLDAAPAKRQADRAKADGPGGENPRNRTNQTRRNFHPTVKPTALMRWLCRLVTPPGGIVLDPFAGSGSTGKAAVIEGFRFVGVELEADYCELAAKRIGAAQVELLAFRSEATA